VSRTVPRWPVRPGRVTLAVLAALLCASPGASAQDRTSYQQKLRPQFHFSPAASFTNDPNGLVYYKGVYHLFYQQRVFTGATGLSCCDWGHAVSRDLMHWEQRPAAILRIPAAPGVTAKAVFSGSAVVDWNNSSGFGSAANPPLVAIYTLSGGGQTQNVAYSTDDGNTWTPYSGNPVLDIGSSSFRDPKVFWYEPLKRWTMVVYGPNTGVRWYSSPNLKDWTLQSSFATGFECPDFFPLALDGDPNNQKWVLYLANGDYWVGDFDGVTFTPNTSPTTPTGRLDQGTNYYAAQTFSDTPGRRIIVGWISPGFSRNGIWPELPWMGAMTVARDLSLKTIDGKPQVVTTPVEEVNRVRSGGVTVANRAVPADSSTPLDPAARGDQLDIDAMIDPGASRQAGLRVLAGQGFYTTVGYDSTTNELYLDRSRSGRQDGLGGNGNASGRVALPQEAKGKPVNLRVLVDRSTLEVYADNGSRVMSANVLPLMNTTLSSAAAAGTSNIKVGTTANFQIGQTLQVNADANGPRPAMQEYTVTNVGTGSLNTTLAASLRPGDMNLKVANVTNFAPGGGVTVGSGASAETFTVAAGGVGTAASNPTTLFADAAAGDMNIKVAGTAGFAPGASVSVDTGSGFEIATVAPNGVGTQGRSTTLAAAAATGDANVKVASVTGLAVGVPVVIGFGTGGPETRTIVGPADANGVFNGTAGAAGTGVTLSAPLSAARASGTAFRFMGTGITLTAPLTAAHTSGAAVRALGTGITLTAAASFAHASGEIVSDPGSGLTIAPALTGAWPAGTPVSTAPATGVEAFAIGGSATVTSATVWNMRSTWLETQIDGPPVGGTVPSTLALTLGPAAAFGAFMPGVSKDYAASTTATVISTASDAALSVADPSSVATGRLVNGAFSLPSPLRAKAASAGGVGGDFADVGSSTSPTTLLRYAGPTANDAVTIGFQQHIGSNDALRSGSYGKVLTYTLSTTTP
jgi:fructan beta-fructosidase